MLRAQISLLLLSLAIMLSLSAGRSLPELPAHGLLLVVAKANRPWVLSVPRQMSSWPWCRRAPSPVMRWRHHPTVALLMSRSTGNSGVGKAGTDAAQHGGYRYRRPQSDRRC